MKRLKKLKPGVVICALFATLAILEFVRTKNWITLGYFGALALVFLFLDMGKRTATPH